MTATKNFYLLVAFVVAIFIVVLVVGTGDSDAPPERVPSLAETEYGCQPGEVAYISDGPTECLSREEVERRNASN